MIDAINATGYGLTFGLQTRIDDRVQHVTDRIEAGNMYVNRNQIGAIVGSQPFGGEGLSGTGPKAGGPHYLARFIRHAAPQAEGGLGDAMTGAKVQARSTGPTRAGERRRTSCCPAPPANRTGWARYRRPALLCLGPGAEAAAAQAEAVPPGRHRRAGQGP